MQAEPSASLGASGARRVCYARDVIPLGTDVVLRKRPWITWSLVIINVTVFLALNALSYSRPDEVLKLTYALTFQPLSPRLVTLLTHMFMHAGWLHLVGNMIVLWVMGAGVENRLGRIGFLAFYLCGGLLAAGAHTLSSNNPILGASGAISAVIGSYLVFFPLTRVRILFLLGLIATFEVPAWWFVLIGVIRDVYYATSGGGGNIAFVAHLGGYGAGFALSILLLGARVIERHDYDAFAIVQRYSRRRRFRVGMLQVGDERARASLTGERFKAGPLLGEKESAALAEIRAEISTAVNEQRLSDAATAYVRMVREFAQAGKAATLSTRVQLAVANHLMRAGLYADAATAYQAYAEAYPEDREAPGVRVLLGLIALRHLRDRARARAALEGVESRLFDEQQRRLVSELRAELAAQGGG